MKLGSFLKSFSYTWKEILTGFISTVLGIAVTIGVNQKLEDNQIEEDKRNLTIMIIHDLDESEWMMQSLQDYFRSYVDKAKYTSEHLDQIAEIPRDTLLGAMDFLAVDMETNILKFPQMAENVLTTNMSNWTTLSNVKFMSNAERCYSYRKIYNEQIIEQETNKQAKKLYRIYYEKGQEKNLDLDDVRKIASEFYKTDEVRRYIAEFDWNLEERNYYIASLHQLNSENKWLMSVSNDDIEEYVKASSKRAPSDRPRVNKKSILGTWQMDLNHEKGTKRYAKSQAFIFNPDYTYRIVRMADAYFTSADATYTHTDTVYGHWRLEDNNLIRMYDSIRMVPTARYASDKQFIEDLAELKAEIENDTTSNRIDMRDIFISDTEMFTKEYIGGKEDNANLIYYRRK